LIKVIDDFLPKGYADEIENTLDHYSFPWYYRPSINNGKPKIPDARFKYAHGFVHNFFNDEQGPMSSYYSTVSAIRYFAEQAGFNNSGYHRLKANLNVSIVGWEDGQCQEPHTDMPSPHTVLIYYVNDSDGDTFIFDKKFDAKDPNQLEFDILERVTPKKNRALFFDGLYYHAGSYPIQHQHRIMLNCNLITV
jgi:hypothetical protein